MNISNIMAGSGSGSASQAQSTQSGNSDTLDKKAFLELLVTQMRHQDPMNPLKQEEYAAQLAQFSSVEQLSNLNDRFDQMYQSNVHLNQSISNILSTSLVGKNVRAMGNSLTYSDKGGNVVNFNLGSSANDVEIVIKDSDGKIVRTEDLGYCQAGDQSWEWDGKLASGKKAARGEQYVVSVEASKANGDKVDTNTYLQGRISGVEFAQGGQLYFLIGDTRVSAGDVQRIYEDGDV